MVVSHTQKSKSLTPSFSITHTIARSSLVFLLFLTIMFLCPTASNSHALCTEENDPACITTKTNSLDTRINVAPVISIALQQAVEIDLTPKSSGTFETATARLQVDTNSTNGFALSISTATPNNSLTNVDTTSHDTIAPLPQTATTDTFPDNTWGYAISNKDESATSFSAVPATTTNIAGLSEHLRSGQYDLTFGTKINTALSAGSYTNSVLISAVANPIEVTSLTQLTYMQDMTTEICTQTSLHETKRLIDTRDGKSYWVAKLKDGNCWMTQNLDYDLIAGKVLTPSDTNVSADYTIKTTTETGVPAYLSGDANTPGTDLNKAQYTERSWNLGDYVLATPLKKEVCETDHVNMPSNQPNTPSYMQDKNNSLWPGETLGRCSDFQYVSNWQPTFQTQTGTWKGELTGSKWDNGNRIPIEGLVSADETTRTYDAHYLVGNYYQFNTATLGSAPASVSIKTDTTRSICPRGWKLPTSGNIGSGSGEDNTMTAFIDKDGSFYNLLAEYGYANSKGYNWNSGNPVTAIIEGNAADNYQNNVSAAPLYFLRGGGIYLNTGSMRDTGSHSVYWSATTYPSSTSAYHSYFHNYFIYPAFSFDRFGGFSVRCLAE